MATQISRRCLPWREESIDLAADTPTTLEHNGAEIVNLFQSGENITHAVKVERDDTSFSITSAKPLHGVTAKLL